MKNYLQNKMGRGEAYVWFTGMGLAVGLMMVTGLLALILVRGVAPLWPKRVARITFTDGAGHTQVMAGEIAVKRTKRIHALDAENKLQQEWQIFRGNKDLYGEGFQYVDESSIQKVTLNREYILLERLEYGDGIGLPVRLLLADGQEVAATSPQFKNELEKIVADSVARWAEIAQIEKYRIGAINSSLEKISLERKVLQQNGSSSTTKLDELAKHEAELQAGYETLAAEARVLRQKQNEHQLVYKTVEGQEKTLFGGQILHFYYPNQATFFGRVGLFLRNLWKFLATDPREANTEGGIFPAIFGTVVMTLLMTIVVTPFGILAAIYLREYAKQGVWMRMVRIAVNNLAGVPSIVFGVFGLGFFVYLIGGTLDDLFFADRLPNPTFGTGGLIWAALTLALLTVPVVIVATEEALAAVSKSIREGSLACGASKWQTISRIVLPAAAPGILTGMILAMARGAGEVAPLMLVGVVKLAPTLPINSIFPYVHLDQKFMHLGFHIYDLGFQSPDSEAAIPIVFTTTLFLILLVTTLNLGAIFIREKLRRKYATGSF